MDAVRRTKTSIKQLFIPGMWFEDMGITYLGPADGHDMLQMMKLFNEAKRVQGRCWYMWSLRKAGVMNQR